MNVHQLPTPALIIDAELLNANLATMAAARPASTLRPHVKAHKCTALAATQRLHGHTTFTCASPREVLGMAAAGLGDDLLLANEVLDPARLAALAAAQDRAMITIAVDSPETVDAAARAGLRHVLIDVNVGLPRCGCLPQEAGRIADVGLKAMGMDHGNPSVETLEGRGADVWFLSDEHVTFVPHAGVASVGDRVRVVPAHIDPTMAMHDTAWLVSGHEVVDNWPIDLRGW